MFLQQINTQKLNLFAIPLGNCEKAKPVNTVSQKHTSKTLNAVAIAAIFFLKNKLDL